jgi:hypothetical protein
MDFFPTLPMPAVYEPLTVGAEWSNHFRFFGLIPDGDSDSWIQYWDTMHTHHKETGWVEVPIFPNYDENSQTHVGSFLTKNAEPILTGLFGDLWEVNAYVRGSLTEDDQKKIVDGLLRLKNGDMPPADWFPNPIYILMSSGSCC